MENSFNLLQALLSWYNLVKVLQVRVRVVAKKKLKISHLRMEWMEEIQIRKVAVSKEYRFLRVTYLFFNNFW